MDIEAKAVRLADYTQSLPDFIVQSDIDQYDHMGALIVDAILQAGINYESVVKPRVMRILTDYPAANTTTAFLRVLSRVGAESLLDFRKDKALRVMELACLLRYQEIETVEELREWIDLNRDKLKRIKGIKDKTVDYIKILAGGEANAIDRHLLNFLDNAGITVSGYSEAQGVISLAAELLDLSVAKYDHSMWTYMSEKAKHDVK